MVTTKRLVHLKYWQKV